VDAQPAESIEVAHDAAADARDEHTDTPATEEPVMSIPRPTEPPRQMSLFGASMDESLLREALEICESSRRASATLLQRKLRIDYEQACVVLAQLAQRGMVELEEDGTQARMRS
jgi:DNA segregation ATPase FtsK/SpoIIIE-like protein